MTSAVRPRSARTSLGMRAKRSPFPTKISVAILCLYHDDFRGLQRQTSAISSTGAKSKAISLRDAHRRTPRARIDDKPPRSSISATRVLRNASTKFDALAHSDLVEPEPLQWLGKRGQSWAPRRKYARYGRSKFHSGPGTSRLHRARCVLAQIRVSDSDALTVARIELTIDLLCSTIDKSAHTVDIDNFRSCHSKPSPFPATYRFEA